MAKHQLIPPDGGWGWMVVLGVALNYMTGQSIFSLFSVVFGDKLVSMGHETTSAAVVMNIMTAVMNFSGLLTGPLLKKFSMRQVATAGGCLVAVGLMLTSFANSIIHIIITYSSIVGLGLGLVMSSSFLVVKTYFQKSRGRAVGLSMAGANCGQMAMPQVARLLLETFGFNGALLVLGAVALHGPLGSLLFHPLRWHAERRPSAGELRPLDTGGCGHGDVEDAEVAQVSYDSGNKSDGAPDDRPAKEQREEEKEQRAHVWWRRVVGFLDLDLLRNRVYLNVLFGTSTVLTASVNYSLLLPFYLLRDVGLSLTDTALCLTSMAAGDFVSRLTIPPFSDRIKAKPRYTFFVGTIFAAITRSVTATRTGLLELCVWCALSGLGRGAAVVYNNLCVADVCPEEKLPAAVGLNMVCSGLVTLAVGPILGYVRDKTESYPLCIHILSVLMLLAMLYWLVEDIVNRCRRKR